MFADAIAAAMASDDALVEQTVFGTTDPRRVADALQAACIEHLGAPAREVLFCSVSVGCVFGLELGDGRRIVVKAFQPRWRAGFLSAVAEMQRILVREGFPCPEPVAGPLELLRSQAVIETLVPDPGQLPCEPAMLSVSARGLARQIDICRHYPSADLTPHPMTTEGEALYPAPHSPIFDFAATTRGAEWIDDFARAAKATRDRTPAMLTVAHGDWSLRNVRLDTNDVLVAYDWDSLSMTREVVAVGQAAATWSMTDGSQTAPGATEIAAYVRAYEAARGVEFSREERASIGASAVYILAYTARCEHAVDPNGELHRRARPRLAADGDAMLELPSIME